MRRAGLRTARQYNVQLGLGRLSISFPRTSERIRTFTACGIQLDDKGRKSLPKVRWYEKLYAKGPVQPAISPEEEELEEVEELKTRIGELEEELREIRDGQVTTIGPLLDQLSEEDRQKYYKALKESSLEEENGHTVNDTVSSDIEQIVEATTGSATDFDAAVQYVPSQDDLEIQMDVSFEQDIYLKRLNASLQKVATNTTDSTSRNTLWRWYSRCKQSLPPFLHLIPAESWGVLWSSQRNISVSSPDRPAHLKILAEDILSTGRNLSARQQLDYIKSLCLVGSLDKASSQWENEQSYLRNHAELSEDFIELGIHLYAQQGAVQKAQNLAEAFLGPPGKSRIRWLIPVIEAWVRSGGDSGIRNAWALYLRLKSRLQTDIRLEDYDKITMSFLHAGQTDIALAVFKDLMLTGQASQYESDELYKTTLGIVGSLHSHSINVEELTKVSMTALTALPRSFQNKFFYASWMKKLIGMGEVTAAASIVELMYERGVKPDAKHLNGIIGAWLRSGGTSDRERAEQMGWAMIQERLEFVAERPRKKAGSAVSDAATAGSPSARIPSHLQRIVPPATIETFCVLLLYYGRRGMLKEAQQLQDCLPKAEILPNSYFMNHLLYTELRRGDPGAAYKLYQRMSPTVQADLETFACLWDCEKAHLAKVATRRADGFPGPRLIFHDMVNWLSQMGKRARDGARAEFTRDLYDQIIRCMCLAKDVEGTIVALYALKDSFLFYPDQDTARTITMQAARIGSDGSDSKTTKRRRSRLSGNLHSKTHLSKIAHVLVLLTEQRGETLAQRGLKVEDLDASASAEEQLFLLAEFLRVILKRTAQEDSSPDSAIEKAAWDMGVGGLRMSDPVLH
ncbi:hypothetical protein MMC08_001955 [Hypocenomyce scalaris]|nr:hypothetical protein [Hypocenomyce scalaris]